MLVLEGRDGTGFEGDVVMLRLVALLHFVYGDVLSDGPRLTCLPRLINKQPTKNRKKWYKTNKTRCDELHGKMGTWKVEGRLVVDRGCRRCSGGPSGKEEAGHLMRVVVFGGLGM